MIEVWFVAAMFLSPAGELQMAFVPLSDKADCHAIAALIKQSRFTVGAECRRIEQTDAPPIIPAPKSDRRG